MSEITDIIPHRPPFLFVDEIVEHKENGIITKRTVDPSEMYFEGHYPGNPIMPGVLLCEAVFQSAAVFLVKKLAEDGVDVENRTPVLSRITEAKFKQIVRPGDEIFIDVTLIESVDHFHFLRGAIKKEGKTVMTLKCALALVDESKA